VLDGAHIAHPVALFAAGPTGVTAAGVLSGLGSIAGALILAGLALYWRRLPLLRGYRPNASFAAAARRFQSGVVNDYVTWIVIGLACLGGMLAAIVGLPYASSDGMFASSSTVVPAGRVTGFPVRSRSRASDSASPSGIAASKRSLACTSGRSMTASTRLARLPGTICPDTGCSEVRTVPSACPAVVTSAAATVRSPSLTST
jgi:hypothetical protein